MLLPIKNHTHTKQKKVREKKLHDLILTKKKNQHLKADLFKRENVNETKTKQTAGQSEKIKT